MTIVYEDVIRSSMTLRLEAKVGTKGQAVIPKPIRDQMGIRPGDTVTFRIEGDRVILEQTSGEEIARSFLEAIPKRPLPDDLDWDEVHGSQVVARWRQAGDASSGDSAGDAADDEASGDDEADETGGDA